MNILAVVGSMREDSYNRQLALSAKQVLGTRAQLDLLDYTDLPPMNQDIEFPAPEAVARVRAAVKSAHGIWFFTPEYNHSFPGVLKNLIDWLSRPISKTEPQVLAGKPAAISGVTLGTGGTAIAQDQLVMLISYLDMRVMNAPRLTIPNVGQQLDEAGRLALTSSAPYLERQAAAFVEFINR